MNAESRGCAQLIRKWAQDNPSPMRSILVSCIYKSSKCGCGTRLGSRLRTRPAGARSLSLSSNRIESSALAESKSKWRLALPRNSPAAFLCPHRSFVPLVCRFLVHIPLNIYILVHYPHAADSEDALRHPTAHSVYTHDFIRDLSGNIVSCNPSNGMGRRAERDCVVEWVLRVIRARVCAPIVFKMRYVILISAFYFDCMAGGSRKEADLGLPRDAPALDFDRSMPPECFYCIEAEISRILYIHKLYIQ